MEIKTYCKLENDKGLENFNLTFVGNGPKPGPVLAGTCKFITVLTIGFKTFKIALLL